MNRWTFLWMVVAMVIALTLAQQAGSQSKSSSSPSKSSAGDGQVQQITLPQITSQIAPGPNVVVYEKDCLICHSARYVAMQPRFSKTVWQAEVKKMVDAYGAQIPETDQALIVEYLMAVKGVEATPAAGTPK